MLPTGVLSSVVIGVEVYINKGDLKQLLLLTYQRLSTQMKKRALTTLVLEHRGKYLCRRANESFSILVSEFLWIHVYSLGYMPLKWIAKISLLGGDFPSFPWMRSTSIKEDHFVVIWRVVLLRSENITITLMCFVKYSLLPSGAVRSRKYINIGILHIKIMSGTTEGTSFSWKLGESSPRSGILSSLFIDNIQRHNQYD